MGPVGSFKILLDLFRSGWFNFACQNVGVRSKYEHKYFSNLAPSQTCDRHGCHMREILATVKDKSVREILAKWYG